MRRTKFSIAGPIVAVCIALLAGTAHAVCPVPEIPANDEFFKRDIVFTGTVISERYDQRDVGGWFYRVRVQKVFRGPADTEFVVYTENVSGRFPLKKGIDYLLLASREQGRLGIDNCTNSAPLAQAMKSIKLMEKIPSAGPYAEIEGWVVAETDGIDVSGIRVICRGKSRTFSAVTEKDGRFRFRAPAGHYQVDFTSNEYYRNKGDFFWYNPNGFVNHSRESAALQLVSVRHRTQ